MSSVKEAANNYADSLSASAKSIREMHDVIKTMADAPGLVKDESTKLIISTMNVMLNNHAVIIEALSNLVKLGARE